jgi:predicted metal-dependent hydrolase
VVVSKKSHQIAEIIQAFEGREWDAHYLGYFGSFNAQRFYEAHDVLEELWFPIRHEPAGDFYKALIQLAGAFVHLQKNRLGPAVALFDLSRKYLGRFPDRYAGLAVDEVRGLIASWRKSVEAAEAVERLQRNPPCLKLPEA